MITIILIIVLIINIPFGFWRTGLKRLSLKWFLAIHIPAAFSVTLKFIAGIEKKWWVIILSVVIFLIGQYIGQIIFNFVNKKQIKNV